MRINANYDTAAMSFTSKVNSLRSELAIAKSKVTDDDKRAADDVDKLNRKLQMKELEEKEAKRKERLKELVDSEKENKQAVGGPDEKKVRETEESKEDKELKSVSKKDEEKSEAINEMKQTKDVFSAQAAMEQMNVRGNAKEAIEGRMSVLEAEIDSDKLRGTDTSKKEEELSKLREAGVEVESIFKNEEPDEMDDEAVMKYFGGPKGFFKNTGSFDEETPKMVIS